MSRTTHPIPFDFTTGQGITWTLVASGRTQPCPECKGDLHIRCDECGGRGRKRGRWCLACDGQGATGCEVCEGAGQIPIPPTGPVAYPLPVGCRRGDLPLTDDAALVEIGGRLFLAPIDGCDREGLRRDAVRLVNREHRG